MIGGGVWLTVLAGRTVPLPLSPDVTQRIRQVTLTETDEERSAFSIVLDAGRSGPAAMLDMPFGGAQSPFAPFTRVVVVVTMGGVPTVLFDGIVTETQHQPATGAGESTCTVTGQDLSHLLDREERDVPHVGLDDYQAVMTILAPYAARGLVPLVVPTVVMDQPLPMDRIPTQQGTDLGHLTDLATRHGYVAYVVPGPVPGLSTFYWGPPVRTGVPQPAITVDMFADTNAGDLSFRTDGALPATASGAVQDRRTNTAVPVTAVASSRPPLSAAPLAVAHAGDVRRTRLRDGSSSTAQALGRAQAVVDRSADAVTAEGRLDAGKYGGVLRPRALVGLRGAGYSQDGLWYVKRVEHDLRPGEYVQSFTLTREGHGSTLPVLRRAMA